MSRNLSEIKQDLKERMLSKEYMPEYIERTEDLDSFCSAIAEFIAPYVEQIESFGDIWDNKILLREYLKTKHMFFNGEETLEQIQQIAKDRLKILSARGTTKMLQELKRISNDEQTEFNFKNFGQCGWVVGRTSPCYRENNMEKNISFIGVRELVVFNIYNKNIFFNNINFQKILEKYFAPKHIATIYNFKI